MTVRPNAFAVAWADALGRRAVLSLEGRTSALDLGVGEYTPPVLALAGGRPVVAWVRHGPAGRAHVVASGDRLSVRCEQAEGVDDGMSIAVAGLGAREALVAWDEDRAQVVRAQRVTLQGGCAPARELSPAGEDASDPVLLGLPGGGAAAFWLAARDVEATVANDTVTEVHGVRVSAEGARQGETLRVTATPAHRFGLSAALAGGAVWLAFRVADRERHGGPRRRRRHRRGEGGTGPLPRGRGRRGDRARGQPDGRALRAREGLGRRGVVARTQVRERYVASRRRVGAAGMGAA